MAKTDKTDRQQRSSHPITVVLITIGVFFIGQILGYLLFVTLYSLGSTINDHLQYGIGSFDTFKDTFRFVIDFPGALRYRPILIFLQLLIISSVTLGLLYTFIKHKKNAGELLGLKKRPSWRHLQYALGGYGVYFVSYIIVGIIIAIMLPQIDLQQEQQLPFLRSTSGGNLVFVFASLVILPPLLEEILMRGFLFGGLRARLKFWPAAIITSFIFAAAHLQWGSSAPLLWAAAIDTFILSVLLVYLREKTGSLWPAVMLHGIKNAVAFTLLFIF